MGDRAMGGGAGFDQDAEHFADEDGLLIKILKNFFGNVVDAAGDIHLGS